MTPAPSISLSATSLSFGNVEKGQSTQQTFRIKNTGTAALSVTTIGTAAPFSVSPAGPVTVNAGDSTTVTVTFAPTSTGAKSGTITITHNASGSPSTVSLSGTGVDTTPPATPSGLTAAAGVNQVTLNWTANTESDLSHYIVYRSLLSNFTPTSLDSIARVNRPTTTYTNTGLGAGTYYFKIAAVDSTGNKSAVSAQASATLAPAYKQSTSSLSFGNVNVGSTGTLTFTVSDTSTAALTVFSIARVGTADTTMFTVSPTSFTVAAGQNQTVTVTFTPTSAGTKTPSLSITHNAAGSPATVSLSGMGQTILLKADDPVPSSLTFVGSSPPAQTVAVSDSGNASMTVTPSITGADAGQFSVSPNAATTVTAGATQTFSVTFTPSPATGNNRSATLSLAHNATNKTSLLSVTLVGDVPPNAPAGLTATAGNNQVTLNWTANTESDLSYYAIYRSTTASALGDSVGKTDKPGTSFTNTGLTPATYYFKIKAVDTAGNKSGESNQASATLAPVYSQPSPSLSFGNVNVGSSGTQTFTVGNTGNAALTVSSISTSGTDASQFTVSPTSFTVNAGATAQTVTVTFTPSSPGAKSASLSITHNAAGSPGSLPLSGAGVDVTPPAAPSGLSATAGNNQASLSWTANTESDLSYYVVYRSTTASALGDSIGKVDKPGTSFTNTGLTPATYYYKIKAVDTAGNKSAESNQASATIQAIISLSATTLNFGDVQTGQTKQVTFTVGNTGTAALTVFSISRVGTADTTMFTVTPTTFTVNPGAAAQTVTVTFAPTSTGAKSASLSVTHNASGSPSSVALNGNGITGAPPLTVNPTTLSFGSVQVGQSAQQTFTLTNNQATASLTVSAISSNDAAFTVSPTSATIAGGQSQTVTVTFAPTASGSKSATITITHNATGSSATVSASGTGTAPAISLSANSLTFGDVQVNASGTLTLTVSNTGNADLSVTGITSSDATFTVSQTSFTVNAGNSQAVTVTFRPTVTGSKTATLTITHNATGSPSTVSMTGNGTAAPTPSITVTPTSLDFSSVQVGQTKSLTLSVSNTGGTGTTLNVSNITVSGTDVAMFTVSPASFTVNAGGAAQAVTVTFAPSSAGAKSASLSIAHNASGSPTSVTLTGSGTTAPVPIFTLEVPSLGFDEVEVNKTLLKELFIKNTGAVALNITSMNLSGDNADQFRFGPTTLAVSPGGRQSIQIVFAPTATGDKTARLNLTHNASGSPTAVPLTGKGVVPKAASIAFTPSALAFGNVKVGQSATQTLTVSNPGTLTLSVTRIATSGTDASQFTVSSTQFDVAPASSQQVTVTFTPASAGAKTASLSVTHNATGSPSSVPLSGTGAVPAIDGPLSFAVGSAGVGQGIASVLRLLNKGGADLTVRSLSVSDPQFAITSPPLPFVILAGGFQDLTITFKPTSQGTKSSTLTISSDDPNKGSFNVSLTGTGTGVTVGVSATALDFGQVTLGQSATRSFNVVNTGNVDFSVSDVTITGGKGQFEVTSPRTFTVGGGKSQAVNLKYTPVEPDTASAALRVVSRDTTFLVGLSGTGAAQAIPVIRVVPAPPDSLLFGAVSVGSARSFNLTVFNDGKATLVVNSIITTDPAYTVSPDTLSVLPNRSRTVAVTFAPTRAGFLPAQVRVSSNDPARATVTVLASGSGLAGQAVQIGVTPRLLNFGQVLLNKTKTLNLIVSNDGGGTLRVVNIVTSSEDFSVSETTFSLKAGEGKTLTITFLPSKTGTINEALTLPSNDPATPIFEVNLRATVTTGAPGAIAALPASLDFGQVDLGKSLDLNLQVRNDGTGPLSVSNVTSDNDQVKVAPTSLTVQPGKTSTAVVTYRPLSRRERSGQLTITSDDPLKPKVIVPWTAQEPASERTLQVTAFSPRKDAVSVPEKTEITVTFDEPILSQKKFIAVDASLVPAPASGDILGSATTQDGGKTVVFPVTLATNTLYRFILFDATSVTGAKLGGPFDISFTTGAAKPLVGAIAGTVSASGQTLAKASVILFDDKGKLISQASAGKDGTYKLADLPAGSYQLYAQGELSDGGLATGTVDKDGDGKPDVVTLAAGQNLTGIDIALKSQQKPTPGGNLAATASLDLDTGKGNQKLATLQGVKANQEIALAVYAENVKDLTGFTATVEYDTSKVTFLSADVASGDENLLRTTGGTTLFVRPVPRGKAVSFGGALLAPTPATAPDGSGLLGVFRFVTESPFTGNAEFTLTRVVYVGLAGRDTVQVGAKATITSAGGAFDTTEVAGPVSLDLDPADGDQGLKTQGGVQPGKTVTVQLFVKGAPTVNGYTVRIEYDFRALKPGSFAAGTLVPGLIGLTNPAAAGVVEVGGASLAGTTGSGDGYLGSIPFQVQDGFSKQAYLAVAQVTFRQPGGVQRVVQERIVGKLTETAALIGDFSGDGVVNFDDFFLFAGKFGTKKGDPGFDPKFDLDNSGAVDFGDFFIFANAFGQKG